jgi:catechol 2,3-dioxygenase-like lactoylglutathione lyase family enzyme
MIRHLAGIAEVVDDMDAAVLFYRDVLGLKVEHEEGSGYGLVHMPGILHFGLWSRTAAAFATFGDPSAIGRISLGFSVGFEVDTVDSSSRDMESKGWSITQGPKTEPWGQQTSRFFSASGALCEISQTPAARRISHDVSAEGEL